MSIVIPANSNVIWTPQPGPQTLFLSCPFRDVLFGGAVGGGKSDALIGDFLQGVEQYGEKWSGVLFRRTHPQLAEIKKRCLVLFSPIYGRKAYMKSETTWYLDSKSGKGTATLRLCHMQDADTTLDHQGHQYTWIGFDEAGQFESEEYCNYLLTRLRAPTGDDTAPVPCFLRQTANPGGVGHHWLKARYMTDDLGIDVPPLTPIAVESRDLDGNPVVYHRMFIPSRLNDNKYLRNDPNYAATLAQISDPILKRALLEGDWTVIAGAAFPEFRQDVHVIPDGPPPPGRMWCACDWGSTHPYCVLFFSQDFDGNITIWGELYGYGGKPNVGSGETPEEVWQKIMGIETNFGVWLRERWLDPQHFSNEASDQTVALLMGGTKARWKPWAKGPGSRTARFNVLHEWLKVVNGRSRLRIMGRCRHLIRTLSTLPRDRANPEDVDSDAEDHAYDALTGGLIKNRLTTQDRRGRDSAAAMVSEYNRLHAGG